MIDALVERPAETAIFVDYDGSLAPIVATPDDAVALPAAIDRVPCAKIHSCVEESEFNYSTAYSFNLCINVISGYV